MPIGPGPHADLQLLVNLRQRRCDSSYLYATAARSHTCALDFFLAEEAYDLIASDRSWFEAEA